MGSKLSPGAYNCHANAEPDEPLFTLLARDPVAPYIVKAWAHIRAGDLLGATHALARADEAMKWEVFNGRKHFLSMESDKFKEAIQCADDMAHWKFLKSQSDE